jgi:hypothetical protein
MFLRNQGPALCGNRDGQVEDHGSPAQRFIFQHVAELADRNDDGRRKVAARTGPPRISNSSGRTTVEQRAMHLGVDRSTSRKEVIRPADMRGSADVAAHDEVCWAGHRSGLEARAPKGSSSSRPGERPSGFEAPFTPNLTRRAPVESIDGWEGDRWLCPPVLTPSQRSQADGISGTRSIATLGRVVR